jgi:guanylate kinase
VCGVVRNHLGDAVRYSISATTRKPRTGEEHGREYFFFSKEEFEALRDQNGFLEWAQVYDNYYGTPRAFVEEVLASGKDCILEIDPQGALQVRKATDEAILVFIAPPSLEELRNRLTGRGTESAEEVEKRLSCAESELAYRDKYDYIIVNDDVETAAAKMEAILLAEKCRSGRNMDLK